MSIVRKVGGEGRNDDGRMERNRAGEEGGLYTPQGAPRGIRRHVCFVSALRLAMSIRIRRGNFCLARTAEDGRRALTPSQFAPDSVNKGLATFGWR